MILKIPNYHVVLHQPDIPQNTGNIGRTCVAVGAKLWLVKPLGYLLDDRYLKRAGMDYWQFLDWECVDSWAEIKARLPDSNIWYITKFGQKAPWQVEFKMGDIYLFGSETRGLPSSIMEENPAQHIRLPMLPEVRSLNLASTANTILYEAVRQTGWLPPE